MILFTNFGVESHRRDGLPSTRQRLLRRLLLTLFFPLLAALFLTLVVAIRVRAAVTGEDRRERVTVRRALS